MLLEMASNSSSVRSFRIADIDCVGFDLDHSLVRYKLRPLNEFIFRILRNWLVENKEYNHKILKIDLDHGYLLRGIVLDVVHGNFLKLGVNGRILQAVHGASKKLSCSEINEIYSDFSFDPIQEHSIPTTGTFERYLAFFTYFEICGIHLIAKLIDLVDQYELYENQSMNRYEDLSTVYLTILRDLFEALKFHWTDWNRGDYFPELRANTAKYVYKRDDVKTWLQSLRKHGKRLFLITNSQGDYTQLLMNFAFGEDWRELFTEGIVVVDAKKPSFFTDKPGRPFKIIDQQTLLPTNDVSDENIEEGGIYAHGNIHGVNNLLKRLNQLDIQVQMQHEDVKPKKKARKTREDHPYHDSTNIMPHVIYFGDHLKSDVWVTNMYSGGWLAGAVLEELEVERPCCQSISHIHPSEACNKAEQKSSYNKMVVSQQWGSFFVHCPIQNGEVADADSFLPSFWKKAVEEHCAIALGCLSHLSVSSNIMQQKLLYKPGSSKCYFIHEHQCAV